MDEQERFRNELCSIPSSMLLDSGLMKDPDKPELARLISKLCKIDPSQTTVPSTAVGFVIDGGSILHKIPWLCFMCTSVFIDRGGDNIFLKEREVSFSSTTFSQHQPFHQPHRQP